MEKITKQKQQRNTKQFASKGNTIDYFSANAIQVFNSKTNSQPNEKQITRESSNGNQPERKKWKEKKRRIKKITKNCVDCLSVCFFWWGVGDRAVGLLLKWSHERASVNGSICCVSVLTMEIVIVIMKRWLWFPNSTIFVQFTSWWWLSYKTAAHTQTHCHQTAERPHSSRVQHQPTTAIQTAKP